MSNVSSPTTARPTATKHKHHLPITTTLLLLLLLLNAPTVDSQQQTDNSSVLGRKVSTTLKFLSPLRSVTLFSKDVPTTTPRDEFLPKFEAGLAAEVQARDVLSRQRDSFDDDVVRGEGWERRSEENERLREERDESRVEKSYDRAVAGVPSDDDAGASSSNSKSLSKYQFVGVVQPPDNVDGKRVKWYARRRPADSKWNVRVVHPNRDAILKDLYVRGKVDIYGQYVNTGRPLETPEEGTTVAAMGTAKPLIRGKYSVKERSWRNLWNFNGKHLFTDSSGAFWRERRLSPGLYTDGDIVYEQSYRYFDGKNGMKPISKLDSLLKSKAIKDRVKTRLIRRLRDDPPDVVVEE